MLDAPGEPHPPTRQQGGQTGKASAVGIPFLLMHHPDVDGGVADHQRMTEPSPLLTVKADLCVYGV